MTDTGASINGHCTKYKTLGDYELDSMARFAIVCGIIAAIVGCMVTLFTYMIPCTGDKISKSRSRRLSITCFVVSLLQCLSLLSKASSLCDNNPFTQSLVRKGFQDFFEMECHVDVGYRMNIQSVIFWILAGISVRFV